MKVCKKCKNEYKDDYIYCPKCGKPYDDSMKMAKLPNESSDDSVGKKIINIILYIVGGLVAFGSLISIPEEITNIFGVLFGISLLPIIYRIIEEKTLIEKRNITIARIVVPIIFLLCIGVMYPSEEEQPINSNNNNSNTSEVEKVDGRSDTTTQPKTNENSDSATKETNTNSYTDAMRKCAVMEGADIYTTGIGKKSDNVFNDGRETCEQWYQQWGEEQFIKAVSEDWNNRQNELIDGKPLSHYLDILGW